MTGAQYIVDSLIRRGVTDAFGIPGGVILGLLYAMEDRKPEFTPHLSYHEQSAGFAACGYAQASGKIGVAYATRGPGFTNLITAMADAYYDSLPALFITAHSAAIPPQGMRAMSDQEMDTCSMVRNITKLAVRIDDEETFAQTVDKALSMATEGRKGPVFLDVASALFGKEIAQGMPLEEKQDQPAVYSGVIDEITEAVRTARRPVILAGDGINQSNAGEVFGRFVEKVRIPVISSRFSHDVMAGKESYFGYVGCHGMRAANFILSKTDLILSLGNRLHFPPRSESYGSIMNHAKLLRVEIDQNEFNREIQNTVSYHCDLNMLLCQCMASDRDYGDHHEWLNVCNILKEKLRQKDINPAIEGVSAILRQVDKASPIVTDVGNNEFWVSRAAVETGCENRFLYSKSFGALGCGLGKAIGAYYACRRPVICFIGDQGMQLNIQELQFIGQHQLPITIVLLNNRVSGMIKDRESVYYRQPLHTTEGSGYGTPDFTVIADAYGICPSFMPACNGPVIIEIPLDPSLSLSPFLPRGKKCQDMEPSLPEDEYNHLNDL